MSGLAYGFYMFGLAAVFLVGFGLIQVWWTRDHARQLEDRGRREAALYDHYSPLHGVGVHPKGLRGDCEVCAKK